MRGNDLAGTPKDPRDKRAFGTRRARRPSHRIFARPRGFPE
ncbi:hypothetical protein U8607_00350 [Methylobacterium durans]|nr:hypothetical protein [Methylobacterium durans]MEA1830517.1 hypothetical protein [Methylobacterium durans]